ncbi:hypothetical protein [Aquibacillus kalidii]|uniref:hypothetical protein n=1 Tax=Aquibacillus kalidii TaxID=2762597 RepID=UPI001645BA75|nr:hypothetical protein [Aquibacillus kalidii]
MKYVFLGLLTALIFWETDSLQEIYSFSEIWQYTANIILIIYFAFLLNIKIPTKIFRQKVLTKDQ